MISKVFLFCILVVALGNVVLDGPSVISWHQNPTQQHQLIIYNITTHLIINTQHIAYIPQSYAIINHNQYVLHSLHNALISQPIRQQHITHLSYLHYLNAQLQEKGQYPSQTSLFDVVSNIDSVVDVDGLFMLMQKHNRVYEIQAQLFSITPKCQLISPMTIQLLQMHSCHAISPHQFIQNELYTKQEKDFIVTDQGLQITNHHNHNSVGIRLNHHHDITVQGLQSSDDVSIQSYMHSDSSQVWIRVRNKHNGIIFVILNITHTTYSYNPQLLLQSLQTYQLLLPFPINPLFQLTVSVHNSHKKYRLYPYDEDRRQIQQDASQSQQYTQTIHPIQEQSLIRIILVSVGVTVVFLVVIGIILNCYYRHRIKNNNNTNTNTNISTNTNHTYTCEDNEYRKQVEQRVEQIQMQIRKGRKCASTKDTLSQLDKQHDIMPAISDCKIVRNKATEQDRYNTSIVMEEHPKQQYQQQQQ